MLSLKAAAQAAPPVASALQAMLREEYASIYYETSLTGAAIRVRRSRRSL